MATSFGKPKLKLFPIRPRSPTIASLMQSCLFILAVNWCLQGMRGMDRKELSFRIALELLLAVAMAGLLARTLPPQLALLLGLLAAHTASFTLNGQVWVCARYCRWYRRDPAALDHFLRAAAAELRGLPWLRESVCIGSMGRAGVASNHRADLDLRLLFPTGALSWLRVNLLLLRLRTRAFFGRIPLDLYAYERPERLRRFDQRERLLSRSIATAGCVGFIRGAPYLGRDIGLDRKPPHLLGLFAGRSSGRARARDCRHQFHRPLRRDLRRGPSPQCASPPHLSSLPPAPLALAHLAQPRPVAGHSAARATATGDLHRSRRRGADLHCRSPARRPADLHRDGG